MSDNMTLSASLEDYLEAIYNTVREKMVARAKDIAKILRVSNSSVTGALRSLSEKSLINYEPYEIVTLTPEGERIAEGIANRHTALRDFFIDILGIERNEAERNACKIEHSVSNLVVDRLVRLSEFANRCPKAGMKWNDRFKNFCEDDGSRAMCRQCMKNIQVALDEEEQ